MLASLVAALVCGCRTPGAMPAGSAFAPPSQLAVIVPDVADRAASEVAKAALASDHEAAVSALSRLRAIDRVLRASEEPATGLVPVSTDLLNATLDDTRAYRAASRELLDDEASLATPLRERLERTSEDDPLELARHRIWDSRVIRFGRLFNAVAEPVGRSIMTTHLVPYRLSHALVDYLVDLASQDPLLLQERQALAHWQRFLRRNPDAPEVEVLLPRVEEAQARWSSTQRKHAVRDARRALENGRVRAALVYADRALRYAPEDEEAEELRREAEQRLLREREERSRSVGRLGGAGVAAAAPEGRPLAVALLAPEGDVAGAASDLLASDRRGPLADEARFAAALARGEAGREDEMWEAFDDLADGDSNMARHAQASLTSALVNPYGAYERARSQDRRLRTRWVLFGPWLRGARDRDVPKLLNWIVDLPSILQTSISAPLRLLQLPWAPELPTERIVAHHAGEYLRQRPEGEHAEEVRAWLLDFEEDRDNWIGALALAEEDPVVTHERVDELREKTAGQMFDVAKREERRHMRDTMYRHIASEFPETEGGHRAGLAVRYERMAATPHRVQVSRGFLLENPGVAGVQGFGLRPNLLDGDAANGELHPDGVFLVGGLDVEIAYVGESGDEDDPPILGKETLSEAHFERVVSKLEETSFRNSLVDDDDPVVPNAQRDVFFERARLGLAQQIDPRAHAEANFAYRGMRERYGVVRARESILPFDIVIQGSLTQMSLGAFPRVREPRKTPDAFLYE